MVRQYVEQRDGGYWVAGTRVSLDSIVYAFLEGQTAESIAQAFPVLSLEQTCGSIAFYLANRPAVDAYLRLAGSQASVEAVDFGLNVAGKPFRLFVADITTDQLLQLRQDPSRLPPGWSIDGASHWGRRAA